MVVHLFRVRCGWWRGRELASLAGKMTSIAELRPFRLCSATPPRKAQFAHSKLCNWRPNVAARAEEGHCFAHAKLCNWRLNVTARAEEEGHCFAHSKLCNWRLNVTAREEEGHCFAHSKLCSWRLNVTAREEEEGGCCFEVQGRGRGRGSVSRRAWRWDDEEIVADSQVTFAEGVTLFNAGEYYECHDVLEGLWNNAPEPQRSILHGILQCAVGLYHLLNQNHRGAMVELGEGLTKLRRADFQQGPLHDFEREASALLEFVYNAQLEHAACVDDVCTRMDGSEQSYQLLGDFGAGKPLYRLSVHKDTKEVHIEYFKQRSDMSTLDPDLQLPPPITVKVPVLRASEEDLYTTL